MESIKQYDTTFTPEGKKEAPKFCPSCNRGLPAAKFKMKYITRDNVKGISRNRCCRECEDRPKDGGDRNGGDRNGGDRNGGHCKCLTDNDILKSRIDELEKTIVNQQKIINDIQTIIGCHMAKIIKLENQ